MRDRTGDLKMSVKRCKTGKKEEGLKVLTANRLNLTYTYSLYIRTRYTV